MRAKMSGAGGYLSTASRCALMIMSGHVFAIKCRLPLSAWIKDFPRPLAKSPQIPRSSASAIVIRSDIISRCAFCCSAVWPIADRTHGMSSISTKREQKLTAIDTAVKAPLRSVSGIRYTTSQTSSNCLGVSHISFFRIGFFIFLISV